MALRCWSGAEVTYGPGVIDVVAVNMSLLLTRLISPLRRGAPSLLLLLLHFFTQGMGVHGIVRLRLAETPDRDPTATEDYPYYQGDELFDGWGLGPNAASLAFRYVVSHDPGVNMTLDARVLCAGHACTGRGWAWMSYLAAGG